MNSLKLTIVSLFVAVSVAAIFSFKTSESYKPGITNYYYFQGNKFYLNERTDMIFAKVKPNVTESQARETLQNFPEIDASKPIDLRKATFIPLREKKNDDSFIELINRMKASEVFDFVGYVFSPLNIDDGKTFFGMSDEFIVQFKEQMSQNQIANINNQNKADILQQVDVSGGPTYLMKVRSESPLTAIEMSNKYYEDGIANYSEPDLYCTNTLCDTTNDPLFFWQWSIRNLGNNVPTNPPNAVPDCDMDVDSAWMVTQGDSTIKIAIIDSGVDTLHPDLVGNMTHGLGWDYVDNDPWPYDGFGHGTAMAGIAAAVGNNSIGIAGIAYRCKIIPIRSLGNSGSPYHTFAFGLIRAWQYGADVINNSWGFTGGASSLLYNAISDAAKS